jgi:hypothetical protein
MAVYGTGINTPPATLVNTLSATTQKYIVPTLGDNIFKPSPAFWGLTRAGKKFQAGEMVYPEINQEETTGGAYYGDQLLNTAVVDSVTPANQVWRHYYQSVSIPVTDVILNRGGSGALDILKVKFQVASGSFLQKLCRALWGTAPQNTTLDIDNLVAWIKTTDNTIAGIDRTSATWFQPAANVAGGSAALTSAVAETAYQSVVYGYDEPDLMLMDNTRFGAFKQAFVGNARYADNMQDKEAIQAGFRYHFLFNNCVVVADRFAPAQEAYILNSKYIFPVFHEADYFKVDPFIKPSNQRVITSSLYLTWQLMCNSPRMNVCITPLA